MTSKNKLKKYTASLTLTQDSPDSPIYSFLEFSPRLSAESTEIPHSYEIMSKFGTEYLYIVGMLDEEGNLVDEEEFHANTEVNVQHNPDRLN